ncbi:SURF1 family cytochrome oxidase biogenesis protein [Novosphingobium resinovorum]
MVLARYRRAGASAQAGRRLPAFVDVQTEQATTAPALKPVPGLTQITFPDSHLSYALTWFAMAALSLVALAYTWRRA